MSNEFTDNIEVGILKKQNLTSFLFIISLLISIYLTYNEQQRIQKKQTYTNLRFDQCLNVINRIYGVLILLAILYLSVQDLKVEKIKGSNTSIFERQVFASILNLISGIIILFIVIEAIKTDDELGSLENPVT